MHEREGMFNPPGMPPNLEAVQQSKISTKKSQNSALYRKISIHFQKISNYGTSSSFRDGVVWAFSHQPHLAHRSPPCKFFGECNLQGAIDFAVLRKRCWGVRYASPKLPTATSFIRKT